MIEQLNVRVRQWGRWEACRRSHTGYDAGYGFHPQSRDKRSQGTGLSMIMSRIQSERSVVVVDVVVFVAVAVADGDRSGHGHGHDHGHVYDLLRLSRCSWSTTIFPRARQ